MSADFEYLAGRIITSLDELTLMQPSLYTLSDLANMCNISNDTLRKYLIQRYRQGVDYFQKVNNGKITIARAIALEIRRYYYDKA